MDIRIVKIEFDRDNSIGFVVAEEYPAGLTIRFNPGKDFFNKVSQMAHKALREKLEENYHAKLDLT